MYEGSQVTVFHKSQSSTWLAKASRSIELSAESGIGGKKLSSSLHCSMAVSRVWWQWLLISCVALFPSNEKLTGNEARSYDL